MSLAKAEQAVRDADLETALRLLQEHVRSHPDAAPPRIFLFQLLSVLGQWDRALTQLNVAAELDPIAMEVDESSHREQATVEREIRIPSSECPSSSADSDDDDRRLCGCVLGRRARTLSGSALLLLASLAFLRCGQTRRR